METEEVKKYWWVVISYMERGIPSSYHYFDREYVYGTYSRTKQFAKARCWDMQHTQNYDCFYTIIDTYTDERASEV